MEATTRLLFAVAVLIGIASGQTAVAMGMAAAPFVSLVVVPWAFSRRPKATAPRARADEEALGLARGGRFAVAVLCIMIAEQTLINGGVLVEHHADDAAVAGYVFNALLIARAPLQLFQAVQGSLLPHLAGLEATEGRAEFDSAIRITILAIAGFAGAVAIGLLLVGPWAMDLLFADDKTFGRLGLAAVAIGMGAHLAAGRSTRPRSPATTRPRPPPPGWSAPRVRRLDAARRRRRRTHAGRGGLPRRRVVVVRAPGRRVIPPTPGASPATTT